MRAIGKSFGGTPVLSAVDFELRRGEVHALLGENGAGKSTLMNVLAGIYAADAGTLEIDGRAAAVRSPADALARGIGMVHQHFRLVPPFTLPENVLLGAAAADLRTEAAVAARLREIAGRTGLAVPLDLPMRALSVAERQRAEILKVLALGARLLVLDEPTAVLTDEEAERLLALVRDLAEAGYGVVLITHKLREVMRAADRVSVLRRGRVTLAGRPVAAIEQASLSEAMIGRRDLPPLPRPERAESGDRLGLAGVGVAAGARTGVGDVSLTVPGGAIVGIAGVGGNGQQELAEAVVGLRPILSGSLRLEGQDVARSGIWRRRRLGLRYIPSDRATWALAGGLTLAENLAVPAVRSGALGRVLVSGRRMLRAAEEAIEGYAVAGATPLRPVRLLSGGNAQKVVLARELDPAARLIVAHSPTRGLDVSACRYVHDQLLQAAARGAGVLLISEDLEEILALADRIHVMSRGRLETTADARPNRRQIGELMLGHA